MEGYNAPVDQGYNVRNDYSVSSHSAPASYGVSQRLSLPMYSVKQEEQNQIQRRSRCPRGAALNKIGSCCGSQCTRACAIEG